MTRPPRRPRRLRAWPDRLAAALAATLVAASLPGSATSARDLSLDALSATRLRPLFSTTRRPPPAPEAMGARAVSAAPPARPQPPDMVLTAVVIGTDVRMAVFKRPSEAKTQAVVAGGNIDGWTLTTIEPRQVVLQRDAEVVSLGLVKSPGKAPATVVPAKQRRAEATPR